MDRCALFVDAGYLLADGAMAVHETSKRESVSWDYAGLLRFFAGLSADCTGLRLLRCYWYEGTVDGRRTPAHDTLADLPGLKLRLGRMRPGKREGVETEIHRDLTTLARNGAISDALLVSAEEDLAQLIADVQDLGIRVILVHISVDGNWTVSRSLRQMCDDLVEITGTQLRPYVARTGPAEPARRGDPYAAGAHGGRPYANGHALTTGAGGRQMLPAATTGSALYAAPVVAEYPAGPSSVVPSAGGQAGQQNADAGRGEPAARGPAGSPAGEVSAPAAAPLPGGAAQPQAAAALPVPGEAQAARAQAPARTRSPYGTPPAGDPGRPAGSQFPAWPEEFGGTAHAVQPSRQDTQSYDAPSPASRTGAGQARAAQQEQPEAPAGQLPHRTPAASSPGYVPQQSPYSSPLPDRSPAAGSSPTGAALADAVQAAHAEGFEFGESVARDAPALWLEAVLARKPRMPSDLEARLLQGSALPIDSLLHDEVRLALRSGFWDSLERSRR